MGLAAIPTGRERRRKGLINRARRGLFGLLLACGATHAQAFELTAPFDRDRDRLQADDPAETAARHLHLSVQLRNAQPGVDRNLFVGQAYRESLSETGQSLASAAASGSWDMLLSADDVSRLREGSGMDLQVPALGYLRLNFRTADDEAVAWPIARGWSLGGSFEQTQVLDGSRIRSGIAFVPQLVLDISGLTPVKDRLNLSFQYAHWHNRDGQANDDRQPQLLLKWSF
ncbi:MAG: hypothetical protein AABY95_05505 [Pseudomonadota bacterium]